MLRKILLIAAASLFVFTMSRLSFAMTCGDHSNNQQLTQAHSRHEHGTTESARQAAAEKSVNAGNKICPVSGDKIDEKAKATYEYKGKIYNFCCPMCIDEFKKDPNKYIKKVEKELQAESKGQSEHGGHGMERPSGHQGHHH